MCLMSSGSTGSLNHIAMIDGKKKDQQTYQNQNQVVTAKSCPILFLIISLQGKGWVKSNTNQCALWSWAFGWFCVEFEKGRSCWHWDSLISWSCLCFGDEFVIIELFVEMWLYNRSLLVLHWTITRRPSTNNLLVCGPRATRKIFERQIKFTINRQMLFLVFCDPFFTSLIFLDGCHCRT